MTWSLSIGGALPSDPDPADVDLANVTVIDPKDTDLATRVEAAKERVAAARAASAATEAALVERIQTALADVLADETLGITAATLWGEHAGTVGLG